MIDRLLPDWLLVLILAASCGWAYVRFEVLEPGFVEMAADPRRYADHERVVGHARILEIEPERVRFQYRGVIYLARSDLPRDLTGNLASLRCRARSDGTIEAIEVLSHQGRDAKIGSSAVAALVVVLLFFRWFRWNRSERSIELARDA